MKVKLYSYYTIIIILIYVLFYTSFAIIVRIGQTSVQINSEMLLYLFFFCQMFNL